jgi:hypothetical protein
MLFFSFPFFSASSVSRWFNILLANMAAAQVGIKSATLSRTPAVAIAKIGVAPQRQFAPLFPPRLCQRGGAPQPSRRFSAYKIRHAAALLVLPAIHFGDNFHISANLYSPSFIFALYF